MIASVYCDGGVIGRNPSPHGGTWAYCRIDQAGVRVDHASGYVFPVIPGNTVSNNVSELYAAVRALESLPDGWTGTLYTDSHVTECRVNRPRKASMKGVPCGLVEDLENVVDRLGTITVVLLGGHPTKAELYAGMRKDGMLVSSHNVFCDHLCSKLALEFKEKGVAT
jgi:ribonuclease HI